MMPITFGAQSTVPENFRFARLPIIGKVPEGEQEAA